MEVRVGSAIRFVLTSWASMPRPSPTSGCDDLGGLRAPRSFDVEIIDIGRSG
jgi:hypothetical protein